MTAAEALFGSAETANDSLDLSCVAVIIPALDEESSLPLVLRDLPGRCFSITW